VGLDELAVPPPVAPMLCKAAADLPVGDYFYEPKWDGFRCLVFRHGDDIELGSRNERPLTRYFPEVVEVLRSALPDRVVVDGEVVVAGPDGLDFELLGQRVHPAASRVNMLAQKTPASFVAFDLLCLGSEDLRGEPFHQRRRLLEEVLATPVLAPAAVAQTTRPAAPGVHLTPATTDLAVAQDWFRRFEGAGLDGVVAKASSLLYLPDKRAMVKVKHERTAEFAVAGFRWHKSSRSGGPPRVGSLMLGLYDKAGQLAHVGVIGAFPDQQRAELVAVLEPYRLSPEAAAGEGHPWAGWAEIMEGPAGRLPGARSRWNADKDLSFELLRPDLVVEAAYEHLQGDRLRHMAQFRRWRPERDARSCTYDQLDVAVPFELAEVFGAGVVPGAPER